MWKPHGVCRTVDDSHFDDLRSSSLNFGKLKHRRARKDNFLSINSKYRGLIEWERRKQYKEIEKKEEKLTGLAGPRFHYCDLLYIVVSSKRSDSGDKGKTTKVKDIFFNPLKVSNMTCFFAILFFLLCSLTSICEPLNMFNLILNAFFSLSTLELPLCSESSLT